MDILPTKRGLKWQKVPLIVVPHGGPQGVRDGIYSRRPIVC
jgi:dipeptidyl aminopeptidase/acylaminoacyl peptidase